MDQLNFSQVVVGTMRLGTWGANLNTKEMEQFIENCINRDLTDFDFADIYGNHTTEFEIGRVLKMRPDLKSKMKVTTKCGIRLITNPEGALKEEESIKVKHYNTGYDHIIESVDKSLSNLGTEQIELLLIHRPDYLMQADEIARAFDDLKLSGKVKYFGVSNFKQNEFEMLNQMIPLVNNQVEFSLLNPEVMTNGSLYYFMKNKILLTAWSPLGGGKLFSLKNKRLEKQLSHLCSKYECSKDQLFYAWIFHHPANIVPVTGTSKLDRVLLAVEAGNIQLEREEWYALLEAASGREVA